MTNSESAKYQQMFTALRRITAYQSVDGLRRDSTKRWGLPFEEALEYAYENVVQEARDGLRGIRKASPTQQTGVAKDEAVGQVKEGSEK